MERIYLSFETAKCHIQLGSDNFIKARNKSRDCLQLAQKINSHTWVANSLILLSTIEFRLNNKTECFGGLTKAIEISRILRVPGVEQFLKKVNCKYYNRLICTIVSVKSKNNQINKMEWPSPHSGDWMLI